MNGLMNEIYLEPSDVSKYKLMVSYYIGTSDNILKELTEQPYNLKIEQSPYMEDLNKVKYSITIPGLNELVKGDYLISNKLAFNSKIGNLLSKIHFNNKLSTSLAKKLQKIKNDIVLKSNIEAIYNLDILLDLVNGVHVSNYKPPLIHQSTAMAFIHQVAFLQEFDTSNLIDLYKVLHSVFDRKNKIPMVRIDDLKSRAPRLLYNLDKNKIERVFPGKYISIFLKDDTSNYEINFYLTNTKFPSGAFKNIQAEKGHLVAEHGVVFKYAE